MRTRKFWSNRIIKIVNYLNNQAEIRMEIMKLNKNFIRFLKEIEEDNLNNYDAKKDEISFWIVNHELNNYDPIGLYPCVLDEYECEADSINKAILELDDEEMKSKINDEFEGLDHIGLNENWDEARIAKDNIFLWASSIRGNEKDLSKVIDDYVKKTFINLEYRTNEEYNFFKKERELVESHFDDGIELLEKVVLEYVEKYNLIKLR